MQLRNHGGECCGITHIFQMCLPTCKEKGCGNRLGKFIKQIEDMRPSGIIEIVLTTKQKTEWQSEMDKYEFKEVNSAMNSNSRNTIHVFHRNSGDAAYIKEEGK